MPKVNQLIDTAHKETLPPQQQAALNHSPASSHQQPLTSQQPIPAQRTSQIHHNMPTDRERQFQESKNVVHGSVYLLADFINLKEDHAN